MTSSSSQARVILLTGPSGSGKSRLAAASGLPVLRLDDFYKEAGDPGLPTVPGSTATDWDAPGSWDADAAVAAVRALCADGSTTTPVYDIPSSTRCGTERLDLAGSPLFVAEGIFAAEIAGRCARLGLVADVLCLRNRPLTTFRRRLLRDLREGRKSWPVLVRRGWKLLRAERGLVDRHVALGAHPCRRDEALARIAALRTGEHAPTAPVIPRPGRPAHLR